MHRLDWLLVIGDSSVKDKIARPATRRVTTPLFGTQSSSLTGPRMADEMKIPEKLQSHGKRGVTASAARGSSGRSSRERLSGHESMFGFNLYRFRCHEVQVGASFSRYILHLDGPLHSLPSRLCPRSRYPASSMNQRGFRQGLSRRT